MLHECNVCAYCYVAHVYCCMVQLYNDMTRLYRGMVHVHRYADTDDRPTVPLYSLHAQIYV